MTILIVDDDLQKISRVKLVLKEILVETEFKCLIANDNASAMKILLSGENISLLILDLNLPLRYGQPPKKDSGIILLKEISRRSNITRPDHIIGLSAYEEIKSKFDGMFNNEGWIIAKFSFVDSNWEETIKNKILYILPKMEKQNNFQLSKIVILTAIKPEYAAVRLHLDSIVDCDRNDTSYEKGLLIVSEVEIAEVIIRECGAKNTNASQETERAIQYFNPDAILFVGIAGSRKPNDFLIGDVIIPEKIYSYESGKALENEFQARPDLGGSSYVFTEKAKKERLKDDWKMFIKGAEKSVKADLGVIASGEMLIEHYNSEIGSIISRNYNDTSAVEMEGFGFAKAVSKQGRETSNIIFGVIRGISDILSDDEKKLSIDRRPENAKQLACDTASAFAMNLIYKLFKKS